MTQCRFQTSQGPDLKFYKIKTQYSKIGTSNNKKRMNPTHKYITTEYESVHENKIHNTNILITSPIKRREKNIICIYRWSPLPQKRNDSYTKLLLSRNVRSLVLENYSQSPESDSLL